MNVTQSHIPFNEEIHERHTITQTPLMKKYMNVTQSQIAFNEDIHERHAVTNCF